MDIYTLTHSQSQGNIFMIPPPPNILESQPNHSPNFRRSLNRCPSPPTTSLPLLPIYLNSLARTGLCLYTAKNVIGNRLSRLKSASLLMQNTISSIGIFLATHSVLLYIIDSRKCFPTMLMGENPRYLMENTTPRPCWEMPTIYRKILMPG